jgi:preprotein translocase subunit SecF
MSPTERFNPHLQDLQTPQDAQGEPVDPESDVTEDEELDDDGLEESELDEGLDDEEVGDLDDDVDDDDEETEENEEDEEVEAATPKSKRVRPQRPVKEKVPRAPREKGEKDEHRPRAFVRMYRGETSFDFVGRRRWWFLISAIIIVAGIASLSVRGLNLGIDFKGGNSWTVLAPGVSQTQATNAMNAVGLSQPTIEILGGRTVQVEGDLNNLSASAQNAESNKVINELAKLAHVNPNAVSASTVGPSWGGQVTQRAITALIVFFILVAIYISFRFEPKMALAAFIAMVHDLAVAVGVYSLVGFQVSPDTVIAILTILGYSLYDTVVVFDRVRDNTQGLGSSGRMTYSEMVNLSMNQTLARSLNTSLVAILPVLAVLVVGAELLGATTLQDYGLALLVGLISGAYSSIFIASPMLAILKEREPRYSAIRQRLESRGERVGILTPSAAALLAGAGGGQVRPGGGRDRQRPAQARSGALRPGTAQRAKPRGPAPGKAQGSSGAAAQASSEEGGSPPAKRPAANRPGGRPPPRPRKGGPQRKNKRRR